VLLEEGLSVSGLVVDKARNQPVADAEIYLFRGASRSRDGGGASPESRARRAEGVVARTDETGAFTLRELPAGSYELLIHHQDFAPARYAFDIGEDPVAQEVRVGLEAGESLRGTVRAGDRALAQSAIIRIEDTQGLVKIVSTADNGRYEVRGLVPGTYRLTLQTEAEETIQRGQVVIKKGSNRFDFKVSSDQ